MFAGLATKRTSVQIESNFGPRGVASNLDLAVRDILTELIGAAVGDGVNLVGETGLVDHRCIVTRRIHIVVRDRTGQT